MNTEVISSMQEWFSQAMEEINATIKDEAALEVGGKGEIGLPMILNLFSSLKAGISRTT